MNTSVGERQLGTVSWFDDARGYGFLLPLIGAEVFCHRNSIVGDNKTLVGGQAVEFEVLESPRGLQAMNVKAL